MTVGLDTATSRTRARIRLNPGRLGVRSPESADPNHCRRGGQMEAGQVLRELGKTEQRWEVAGIGSTVRSVELDGRAGPKVKLSC
jgi:hypothetical protein